MFDPDADEGLLNFERSRTREAWRAEKGAPLPKGVLAATPDGTPVRRKASLQTVVAAPPHVETDEPAEEGATETATTVAVPARPAVPPDPGAPLRHLRLGVVTAVALLLLLLWLRQRSRR